MNYGIIYALFAGNKGVKNDKDRVVSRQSKATNQVQISLGVFGLHKAPDMFLCNVAISVHGL